MTEQAATPLCDSCGTADVSQAAIIASRGLRGMPDACLDWMVTTYGQVPSVLCSACFIPALSGANHALAAATA